MISVRALTFAYPGHRPIFSDLSWTAEQGEAWAILGPSGCGKSTLLYLLAGLRLPTAGEIHIEGQSITRPRPRTGLILQDYGLLPWATCAQNVSLGLRIHGFYGPDGKHAPADSTARGANATTAARTSYWLDRLGLTPVSSQYPSQLSGGQRQRTAIARTLALGPDLLLMDEPFASLDAPTRENLQNLTLELRAEQRLTTIVVTHAIDEAAFLGQRILLLGRDPEIIDNPGAGHPAYRDDPRYQAMIQALRARLGAGATALPAAAPILS
jgi:NitT/TauT family transport system ATP-binding protein